MDEPVRSALITGGTGGLGVAVVSAFRAEGWHVTVAATRAPARAPEPGIVHAQGDLGDPASVAEVVRVATGAGAPPLRAVVNLVGGYAGDQPVATAPLADFEAQLTRNLRPTYLVTQATLGHLVAAGGGAIVCVSSRAALHPFAGAAGYCASKAAVITLAQVVAREHAADGVRCNAVLPAQIATPAMLAATPPERRGELVAPAAIAAVIRFLCSDESAPTTGAAIPVYGSP